jgi:hypothetical protein
LTVIKSKPPWPEVARLDEEIKGKLRRLRYWRVMFHNGIEHLPAVTVVAPTRRLARAMAEPTVPVCLYGSNVVFLKAQPSLDPPLTLNEEAFKLIAEKSGVHL